MQESEASLKSDLQEAQHRVDIYKYDVETLDEVMDAVANHVLHGPEQLRHFRITPATILACVDEAFGLIKHLGQVQEQHLNENFQLHTIIRNASDALQPKVLGVAEPPSQSNLVPRIMELASELIQLRALPETELLQQDRELIDEVLREMNKEYAPTINQQRYIPVVRGSIMTRLQTQFAQRRQLLEGLSRQSQDKIRLQAKIDEERKS